MKVILIGYPGSQKIQRASQYLTSKYLPGFTVIYFNYKGNINNWSYAMINYLNPLDDEYVIFGLDDYLLNALLQPQLVEEALRLLDKGFLNVKLCECTPEEQAAYPVTTQYTLWNKDKLVEILAQTTTPWDFEINGSKLINKKGYKTAQCPALKYYTNSSLSNRWEGVRLDGLNEEDTKMVQTLI